MNPYLNLSVPLLLAIFVTSLLVATMLLYTLVQKIKARRKKPHPGLTGLTHLPARTGLPGQGHYE